MASQDPVNPSHAAFDLFIQAQTCKDVQRYFAELCKQVEVDPKDFRSFYTKLKERLNYWKAKALWTKLDKRASHPDYEQGKVCAKNKCLVLGAGPCGLRTAIELSLLGAQVVVVEKRETFSRNNVLHLWPYTIYDLRGLGAKKFYGRFCTGALDHISIRQLQLILLKVSLLLGVEVHTGVDFQGLIEPSGDKGWTAKLHPGCHPAAAFQFDVFISAGGGRFIPDGFKHKELRGKLAIGITANFINRHTAAEAQVAEISGVARIYNQKFFQDLLTATGIDLENIVYYKDDTHYFVMTAKKKSLLKKGVIKQDYSDAEELLAPANVDHEALCCYAREAAHFSTGGQLPDLQFAQNHAGRPDVAMFDFTCMHRAENASLVKERKGKKLLIGLVGDCLVEPFWPLGTGIARGFLAAFDAAWMVRSWGKGTAPLKVLSERESVYQLLSQTTPENTSKNYAGYSIDPSTRYQHINFSSIKANQVQHLYVVDDSKSNPSSKKQKNGWSHMRQDSVGGFDELIKWCQKHTAGYENVNVKDLTQSWRSGLALCALIHHFRPQLIDMSTLDESNAVHNNQLAFSILERELGISPIMSASDMASSGQIDKLSMVLYLTQIQDAFAAPPLSFARTQSAVFFLNKLKHNSLQRRKLSPTSGPKADSDVGMAVSTGNSEECYFCGQRVYVLERISAEGKFFHRSCFTCHQCGITLRLGGYTFNQTTGEGHLCHSFTTPSPQPSPPVPKPRSIHLVNPSPPEKHSPLSPGQKSGNLKGASDSRPKQSLRKLQLTDEEKSQLVNLQSLSLDSDSETPGGSSSCSSSSATAGGPSPPKPAGQDGQEEEGYWSGSTAGHVREKRNRRCFRRKEEPGGQTRVRSKFSPWNLSSPRLSRDHRLSVLNNHPGRVGKLNILTNPFCWHPQSIQRRLEEIEVTFKELEDKGVVLEQALRGEAGSGGSPEMIEHWIQLVHQKNALVSEESDLMVASRQLELEDKQSMLEMELRRHMELSEKTTEQQEEEDRVLQQMIEVVDMRDSLVAFLEEKRLKEMSEEQEAFSIMEAKRHSKAGAQVHWA
uniref:Molecule interacting with CasL protein 1 n=1 Tax=Myripristis murdjan TaxID=586833 RepID=A0A667YIV2_9TELE